MIFSHSCTNLTVTFSPQNSLKSKPTILSKPTCSSHNYSYTTHMFEEMPQRNLSSLNSQLSSYVRQGKFDSTLSLFRQILRNSPCIDSYTFTPVLGACTTPQCGTQVHCLMIKFGTESGIVSKTALMTMYSKTGCLTECVNVFDELELKDVVAWNSLLSGFLRQGEATKALGVFGRMRKEKVVYSEFTFTSVIKACTLLKFSSPGKQVHGLVIVMGRDLVILGTALIDFYSEIGCVNKSMRVFSELRGKEDSISHNSILNACVKNRKFKDVYFIMSRMRPNLIAVTTILSACSENSDILTGKQIHSVAIQYGFIYDTQLCNVLVDMYAKCGKISYSRSVFDTICRKDVVSYTNMMNAYGVNGEGEKAFALLEKMDDVLPNSVTFLAVLSACGHSGTVEQGWECFNSMRNKYNIDPSLEHYACFMDGLGRAGKIEDMWRLHNDMVENGVKSTSEIWATLLNACILNQDISRGEFAAKQLLESGSAKCADYVLVSNFYAAIKRWDIVDNLRSLMRELWPNKTAGSSLVRVTGL